MQIHGATFNVSLDFFFRVDISHTVFALTQRAHCMSPVVLLLYPECFNPGDTYIRR